MANENGLPGLYHKIPTNIRLVMEQIFGADSTITEQDFTAEELAVMRDLIIDQEARNVENEAYSRTMYEKLTHPDYGADWDVDVTNRGPDSPMLNRRMDYSSGTGRLEYASKDILEAERQQELDKWRRGIESYEKTRDKLSIRPPLEDYITYADTPYETQIRHKNRVTTKGWLNTLIESFSSPETNVSTTLGHFNVIKNDDGTVTIKDTYSWNPVPPDFKLSLKDFLTSVWQYRDDPEGLGNMFMRLALPERERDVEINLPMRGED